MALHIAIVEDEKNSQKILFRMLKKYSQAKDILFEIECFENGQEFLENQKTFFDIVFLDIEMPVLDGMKTAEMLRKSDSKAIIIFITNMAQYAIAGYEVNALYFILKPVYYPDLEFKMDKAVRLAFETQKDSFFLITNREKRKIFISDIYYIEVMQHKLLYHTKSEVICENNSLETVARLLKAKGFSACHKSYLVNMAYVKAIKGNIVYLKNGKSEEGLVLSRGKKQEFLSDLNRYYSGGINSNVFDK